MLPLILSFSLGQVVAMGRDPDSGINRPILINNLGEVFIANPYIVDVQNDGGLTVCSVDAFGTLTCPPLIVDGGLTVYGNAVFNGYVFAGNVDAGSGTVYAVNYCTPGGCFTPASIPATTWWVVDGGVEWLTYSRINTIDAGNEIINGTLFFDSAGNVSLTELPSAFGGVHLTLATTDTGSSLDMTIGGNFIASLGGEGLALDGGATFGAFQAGTPDYVYCWEPNAQCSNDAGGYWVNGLNYGATWAPGTGPLFQFSTWGRNGYGIHPDGGWYAIAWNGYPPESFYCNEGCDSSQGFMFGWDMSNFYQDGGAYARTVEAWGTGIGSQPVMIGSAPAGVPWLYANSANGIGLYDPTETVLYAGGSITPKVGIECLSDGGQTPACLNGNFQPIAAMSEFDGGLLGNVLPILKAGFAVEDISLGVRYLNFAAAFPNAGACTCSANLNAAVCNIVDGGATLQYSVAASNSVMSYTCMGF